MEGGSPRKPGVQIAVSGEDVLDDPVTPEADVVKAKLEAHNIKQMGTLLKVGFARSPCFGPSEREKKKGGQERKLVRRVSSASPPLPRRDRAARVSGASLTFFASRSPCRRWTHC
jgi:hypothetical protein